MTASMADEAPDSSALNTRGEKLRPIIESPKADVAALQDIRWSGVNRAESIVSDQERCALSPTNDPVEPENAAEDIPDPPGNELSPQLEGLVETTAANPAAAFAPEV